MDILVAVGGWIRTLRKQHGLSQEELGEKTGLSSNYISLIERGHKQVTMVTLAKISDALEVSLEEVFKTHKIREVDPKLEKELTAINESLLGLKAEDIRILRQFIERFGKKYTDKKR